MELVLDRGEHTTALLTFGLWVACFLLRAFRSFRKKTLIFFQFREHLFIYLINLLPKAPRTGF